MRNLLPLLFVSCAPPLFSVTGFTQESFSPKADILFIVDNSDSMQEEATSLATSFAAFVGALGVDEDAFPTNDLSDAVSFYSASTDSQGAFINYQLGIVSTDGIAEGAFTGSGRVTRFDDDVGQSFARNLLCDTTCFIDAPPQGNTTCGDDLGDEVTRSWLACECSDALNANLSSNCGSAVEEPLEAVLMAMCRSVPNPPASCFDPEFTNFTEADVLSNGPFLRPDATLIPVIISDEGDDSRRIDGNDPDPQRYKSLFAQFDQRMVWSYVGPDRDDSGDFRCGSSQFGANRIMNLVESTGGLYTPINDLSAGCEANDFAQTLAELGDLLLNLNRSFRLKSLPVEGTIAVHTSDGGSIPEAAVTGTSVAGVTTYGDGWSYDFASNTVLLHGSAIPGFEESVQVYYLPLDANPRDLPF